MVKQFSFKAHGVLIENHFFSVGRFRFRYEYFLSSYENDTSELKYYLCICHFISFIIISQFPSSENRFSYIGKTCVIPSKTMSFQPIISRIYSLIMQSVKHSKNFVNIIQEIKKWKYYLLYNV